MTPVSQLEKFFCKSHRLNLKAGSNLLSPGQLAENLYFLHSGLLNEYGVSRSGTNFLIHLYKPGSIFPLIHSFNDLPVIHYYQAYTDCSLYSVPTPQVTKFLIDYPQVQLHLFKRILRTLGNLTVRTQILAIGSAYARTAWVIAFLAKNLGRVQSGRICIPFHFTHKDISDWIGTSRETVSIQIARLRRKGLITCSHHFIYVSDLNRLEKEHSI